MTMAPLGSELPAGAPPRPLSGSRAPTACMAACLAGSWRQSPPALTLSVEDVDSALELLLASGCAGLAWRSLCHAGACTGLEAAAKLLKRYGSMRFEKAVYDEDLADVLTQLAKAGIRPVHAKGGAAARFYAEPALRRCGDIDLFVAPEEFDEARRICERLRLRRLTVDLHDDMEELGCNGRTWTEMRERTQTVDMGRVRVRVLCPEDDLAFLALHLVKHGGFSPTWFCDIAARLESLPADFDWELCLGRRQAQASWILATIHLAHELLGARLDALPPLLRSWQLPRWTVRQVLKEWETPGWAARAHLRPSTPVLRCLADPPLLLAELRKRFPNPLVEAWKWGLPIVEVPELPLGLLQVASMALDRVLNPQRWVKPWPPPRTWPDNR